jgi:hypothetical protein
MSRGPNLYVKRCVGISDLAWKKAVSQRKRETSREQCDCSTLRSYSYNGGLRLKRVDRKQVHTMSLIGTIGPLRDDRP